MSTRFLSWLGNRRGSVDSRAIEAFGKAVEARCIKREEDDRWSLFPLMAVATTSSMHEMVSQTLGAKKYRHLPLSRIR